MEYTKGIKQQKSQSFDRIWPSVGAGSGAGGIAIPLYFSAATAASVDRSGSVSEIYLTCCP